MFLCNLRTQKNPIPLLQRSLSSKSADIKTKRIPQKNHNLVSKLQFGPLLRSKSKVGKSKPINCGRLSESDESKDYWLSTVKINPQPQSLPEKITINSSRTEIDNFSNIKTPTEENIVVDSSLAENSSNRILRIPFSRQEDRNYPSVSRILRETMSAENRRVLDLWEQRMLLELGEDGFNRYKLTTFSRGKAIHSWIENYFLSGGNPEPGRIQDEVTKRHISSISPLLATIRDIKVLESATFHPKLKYCGKEFYNLGAVCFSINY